MSIGRSAIVGVDVGGTFTDVFWVDEATGECRTAKVPSTPTDQSRGFIEGVVAGAGENGVAEVATVVHGTTVGTNALLERKSAKCGLITTHGFRDVLEMRRRDRPEIWGLRGSYNPIIPRDLRFEVEERTLADGSIRLPVDTEGVVRSARKLIDAGAEALAIMFVNSYANPENERAARDAVRKIWPNDHITLSSDILPELREFERTSTTALNATLQPVIGHYLENLQSSLKETDFEGDILIVQSNGGVMSVKTAQEIPVKTTLSGPAAGVIAGAHIATSAGYPNVVTCDMGGTSFDVALVADGESELAAQSAIDFGLVVRTPMIQITTIGAGGGSIAYVDRGGILQVGPESAGADPGPACYGNGNERPTVTDANVLLGRINVERPIGGKLKALDLEAARQAIFQHVGNPLGLADLDAAEAIIRVANSRMAGAIRLVSIERGHDPRKFTAMPFGGGGALHAGAIVKDVGLAGALIPRYPGVTSALGCVIADMRHDFVQTINRLLDDLDLKQIHQEIEVRAREGGRRLEEAGIRLEATDVIVELDILYVGQTHTVSTPFPGDATDIDMVKAAFEASYKRAYGRILEGIPCRIVNLRVSVVGRRPRIDLSVLAPPSNTSIEKAECPSRDVYIEGEWHQSRIFDRLALPIGAVIYGPALLEQSDATTFIDPYFVGRVDEFGNVVVTLDRS